MLRSLPGIFLGYGKLLVTIVHTDSYVINSENFKNLNDQLRNGCVLVQGYGIRNPADVHYESFPLNRDGELNSFVCDKISNFIDSKFQLDLSKLKWVRHRAIEKLDQVLNLTDTCGYITFVNTGVPDIGCEQYDIDVHLKKPRSRNAKEKKRDMQPSTHVPTSEEILVNK